MKIVLIKKLGVFRVVVNSRKFEHFIRNLLFMAKTVKNEIAMDELAENVDGYFQTRHKRKAGHIFAIYSDFSKIKNDI